MTHNRQWVVDTLRHLGYTQQAEDAQRDLPEEIDDKDLRDWGNRHGISGDELRNRMGGSP